MGQEVGWGDWVGSSGTGICLAVSGQTGRMAVTGGGRWDGAGGGVSGTGIYLAEPGQVGRRAVAGVVSEVGTSVLLSCQTERIAMSNGHFSEQTGRITGATRSLSGHNIQKRIMNDECLCHIRGEMTGND